MYARLKNNEIVKVGGRPNWYSGHPDDGGRLLTDAELKEHGWLPVIDPSPTIDPLTEKATRDGQAAWTIGENEVTVTYTITEMSPEEKEAAWNRAVDDKKEQINSTRDVKMRNAFVTVEVGGLPYQFDTRQETIARITGAAVKAIIDPTFTVDWITQSNDVVTLDANGIIAVGNAMAAQEAAFVFQARALKDQVEAIAFAGRSQAALDAIVWPE